MVLGYYVQITDRGLASCSWFWGPIGSSLSLVLHKMVSCSIILVVL